MEKYGVIREYECECGTKIQVPDAAVVSFEKNAETVPGPSGHAHVFKEKKDVTGETEGRVLRPDGLVEEA
jgi:hypothetical protein